MKWFDKIRWFFQSQTPGALRVRRVAKVVLLLVLFGAMFAIVPIGDVLSAILSADPWYLILGITFSFLATILTAVQLTALARKQGITHSALKVLSITLAAKFYSQFSPGNIVASGIKWYRLSQPGNKTAESLAVLAFFRLMETFLNIALGLGFWLLSDLWAQGEQRALQISAGWLAVLVLGVALLWIFLTRLSLPLYTWFERRGGALWQKKSWQRLSRYLQKFLSAAAAYADFSTWELSVAIFAAITSQLSGVVSNVFVARAVGIHLSLLEMGWIYSVIILVSQLPFAFAGGLGLREVSLVFLFATFGIGADLALAFSFLLFVRGVLISLVGGAWEALDALQGRRAAERQPGDAIHSGDPIRREES